MNNGRGNRPPMHNGQRGYNESEYRRSPRLNMPQGDRGAYDPRMANVPHDTRRSRAAEDPRGYAQHSRGSGYGYGQTMGARDARVNGRQAPQNPGVRRDGRGYGGGYADSRGYADPQGYNYGRGGDGRYAPQPQRRGGYDRGYNGGYYGEGNDYGRPVRDPLEEEYRRAMRAERARIERERRAELARRRAIEKEKMRRLEERLKKEKKMRRRRARKIFCGRAVITLVVFAILLGLTSVVLALHFTSKPDGAPSAVTYTYGGKTVREVSRDTALRGGKLYVCFNDVADYLGLHVTGDVDSMKFIFPAEDTVETGSAGVGSEDCVVFMADSRTVIVNSRSITVPAESFIYGESVWVSAEFLAEFVDGLDVSLKGDTVATARKVDEEKSTEDEVVYLEVSLKLKSEEEIPPVTEEEGNGSASLPDEKVEFTTDLSAYEQYMNPENADDYLILVNNTSTLDASYAPGDLVNIVNTRQDGRETQLMRECAEKALEALFIEMYAAGYTDVSVTSGYRAYSTQEYLHNTYIANEMASDPSLTWEQAKAIVLTYSAEPGTSEHQTGLCVDMHNLPSATSAFANEEAYIWLCDNAWKFGFILRFPEGKSEVMGGITYEPWHWRFVGREHARAIYAGGLCLEEYVAAIAE